MTVPPPTVQNVNVQHIVGNTLITSTAQPQATQTHQIYSQLPVSLQQTLPPSAQQQQTIHVGNSCFNHVSSGQHFLVNTQQWPQQQMNVQNVQSFQLTAPQHTTRNANVNEVVMVQQPTIITPFNQPPPPSLPQSATATSFSLSNQVTGIQFQQQLPPPSQMQQTTNATQVIEQSPQQQIQYQSQAPQPVPFPHQVSIKP